MTRPRNESVIQVLWAIFGFVCLAATLQNSFAVTDAAPVECPSAFPLCFTTEALTKPLISRRSVAEDQGLSNLCQQCLAQGMLTIPACSIAATAPAFPETETDPVKIQAFKNLYPMAVQCLCIANATSITTAITTQVEQRIERGALRTRGWVDPCDNLCSVSMVMAQIRTLAVLSRLMGCDGAVPVFGPGSTTTVASVTTATATGTTTTTTAAAAPTTTVTITTTTKTSMFVTVPKMSRLPDTTIRSKKVQVPQKSGLSAL
ncbi:hypothetical protein EMPS_09008 [Entomortierella parvispora]|uniref:Uncharacterized protein n=1 Tax=Entomortierella parvispora TaxID=205924 RepID=A0A9P3HH57_9FUNG|nr:hypothetical protein EMPS_09008 [Entomortierella parvispora]